MKHTFTREQIKTIIVEELQADLLIENTEKQILEEGMLDTIKNLKNKYFPNKTDEEIEQELEDITEDPETLNKMPRGQRIGILFLAGMMLGFFTQAGFDYGKLTATSAADAQKVKSSLHQGADKSKDIKNFMQIAAAEAEGGTATTPEEVDAKIKEIVKNYAADIEKSPISPGRGIFIGGDVRKGNMRGFVHVDPSAIPDNEVMPFIGISKKDYETLLRATYLSGEGGDQRLENLVMGKGVAGSSGYWAYDNKNLFQGYNEDAPYAVLPLEWSVAYDLLQKRKSKGRL
jgi:uncharacterized protein (UPF0305 family)